MKKQAIHPRARTTPEIREKREKPKGKFKDYEVGFVHLRYTRF